MQQQTEACLRQGSEEWRLARCGSLGASQIGDALAEIKSGWGASRDNLKTMLVIERLTGKPVNGYTSQAMLTGIEREPTARMEYAMKMGVEVKEVGLIRHPTIKGTHASPDGLIGDEGLLELKCPEPKAHLEFLLGSKLPKKYILQCNWQIICCQRQWVDFVSWNPDFPPEMQMFIQKVNRGDGLAIRTLETMVSEFLAEIDATVAELTARYPFAQAAA
jgi:hypothetical protein